MGKQDILVRENRLRALTQEAVKLLKAGLDDFSVEEQLREIALDNWGVSPATLYNYANVALRRAKRQLGLTQQQQGRGGSGGAGGGGGAESAPSG